jgi:CspA family cold shock protein
MSEVNDSSNKIPPFDGRDRFSAAVTGVGYPELAPVGAGGGTDVVRFAKVICPPVLYRREMAKGKVDFFNDTGGYGFIETEDADEDVFFHMEDVGGPDLEEGQELEFDIEQAPKGPRATNVTRL